jgi:hypothetical protein
MKFICLAENIPGQNLIFVPDAMGAGYGDMAILWPALTGIVTL